MSLEQNWIAWGRVGEISLSNRANLSQSELSEMHFIRVRTYGVCEHGKQTDLRFKVKQIQCAQITWRKSFAGQRKLCLTNIHDELGPEKQVEIIKVQLYHV